MPKPIMHVPERAAQLWPLLAFAATHHHLLTYGEVGELIGVTARGLGHLLEPIQSYCMLRKLPPLTAIVVKRNTGRPGSGFSATVDPTQDQHDVFRHDWLRHGAPSPYIFKAAAKLFPTCGGYDLEKLPSARDAFASYLKQQST